MTLNDSTELNREYDSGETFDREMEARRPAAPPPALAEPPEPPLPTQEQVLQQLQEDEFQRFALERTRRAENAVCLRAMARTMVSLAAEMGGHDPRYNRPADAVTADNIEALLLATHDAKSVQLPPAFRQGSAGGDLEHAHRVGNALSRDPRA